MRAAAVSLRKRQPREIIAAVPVGAPSSCAQLLQVVDRLICLAQPEPFYGVGLWYREFAQTSDEEVRRLLEQNRSRQAASRQGAVHADPPQQD